MSQLFIPAHSAFNATVQITAESSPSQMFEFYIHLCTSSRPVLWTNHTQQNKKNKLCILYEIKNNTKISKFLPSRPSQYKA